MIAKEVRSRNPSCQIFIDSGITRGTDVMKCLALGANGVFVSRTLMWGLYKNGEEGVQAIMKLLNDELKLAMALTHCFTIAEITEK